VYFINGAGSLAGTLILDGQNDPDAIFVFKFAGAFGVAAQSKMILSNGARRCNVFFIGGAGVPTGAISIGAGADLKGTFLSHDGACTSGADLFLSGRLLSTGGAVTTYAGIVYNNPECVTSTPLSFNNPPVAVDDAYSTDMNVAVSGNVITNDSDPDGNNITVNTAPVTPPSHGSVTLNADGTFTYTPTTGYVGTDTFVYEISDDGTPSLTDQAIVTITINSLGEDSDGDGVLNGDDDYPNDPDRAFDNYYPAGENGTLAYEDLWPARGDYDFNDLVCDYRFKMVTNASNKVVEVFGSFIVKAFGASLKNGFGFQLSNNDVANSDITVSGYDLQEGYISLNANGLENGQTKPTIIVFDNCYNILTHPGEGIGVNTTPSAPYVEPDTLVITIIFTPNTYTLAQIDIPNFNPFLIVNKERGKEVHLPDYTPTDLVDITYFGTSDDDSNPATGKYYKTANNLPWAINIYNSFDYPKEKIDIINAYNHFTEWAESSGNSYPDWYMDKTGYRNENNIYQIPGK
nr:LruC domain-containing protein [Bacteroidota bacterium]